MIFFKLDGERCRRCKIKWKEDSFNLRGENVSSLASTRIALSEKGIDLRSLPARSRTEMKQVDALVFAYTLHPHTRDARIGSLIGVNFRNESSRGCIVRGSRFSENSFKVCSREEGFGEKSRIADGAVNRSCEIEFVLVQVLVLRSYMEYFIAVKFK